MLDQFAWVMGAIGFAIGLGLILFADRYLAALKRWIEWQLVLVQKPSYLKMHKLIGWALFVFSVILLALLYIQSVDPT